MISLWVWYGGARGRVGRGRGIRLRSCCLLLGVMGSYGGFLSRGVTLSDLGLKMIPLG